MATLLTGCWLNFRHFVMVVFRCTLILGQCSQRIGTMEVRWVGDQPCTYVGEGERSGIKHMFSVL